MVNIPAFTKTKEDIGQEIRGKKDELTKLNFDYEFLKRKVEEYNEWVDASFGNTETYFKEVAEEIAKDDKVLSDKLDAKNAELKTITGNVVNIKQQKGVLEKDLAALKSDKNRSDIQLTDYSKQVNGKITILDNEYDELRLKVADLNQEKEILDDKLKKGTIEIDARRKVLREWSDKLHQKERDVRLWEVRIKRKVRDNFPSIGEIKI